MFESIEKLKLPNDADKDHLANKHVVLPVFKPKRACFTARNFGYLPHSRQTRIR